MSVSNPNLDPSINEYNELVQRWNQRFGTGDPIQISNSEINQGLVERLKIRFGTNSMTVRQKLRHTETVIGDFATLNQTPPRKNSSQLTRSELAYLITKSARDIRKEL